MKKVLIVEDDSNSEFLLRSLMELNGYKPQSVADGKNFLNVVKKFQPDVILLDLMLPEISGLDLCRLLRNDSKMKDVPVVAVTALATVGDAEKAFAAGVNDYVSKPFEYDRLMLKVKKVLGDIQAPAAV